MTYRTEEERTGAIKVSRRRYYLKRKEEGVYRKKDKVPVEAITKEQRLIWAAKSRAKSKGLDFSLELTDIYIPDVCPVLGIEIVRDSVVTSPNSPSLDRWDSTKGYTKENVRVISWRANKLKSDANLQEMEKIVSYMKERT